ncbi:5,6-dimethylbenzimidazole synthase [Gordonia sp. (in: high G+C Gram-positive bacteria)]|uniref:5,6-dimethylbenzimidazole synthase n=1 Tax=Gordonia sp. (in: high G+C Gram-positive bacteria) TaxID=84139 RepID=UPI003F9639B4
MVDRIASASDGTFDRRFVDEFDVLLQWRRDVRRFRTDPLAPGLLDEIIASAELAPSVGNSQPWRWVDVRSAQPRAMITASFERCNAEALDGYRGDRARQYAALKLSGLHDAPIHLAAFCAVTVDQGHGLGRRTMPQTLEYSVATAVSTLWLAARARGVGVGWVSIVDPDEVIDALGVPDDWSLVAYLCIGYPESGDDVPALERAGWQARTDARTRYRVV